MRRLNVYRYKFARECPSVPDYYAAYELTIETSRTIKVEDLMAICDATTPIFHEDLADQLASRFGGTQRLVALHHGVHITTVRESL